jgi:hypothetical protein
MVPSEWKSIPSDSGHGHLRPRSPGGSPGKARPGRDVAVRSPAGRSPAVADQARTPTTFRAGGLPFSPDTKLRDECWSELDSAVKARIEARTGPIRAWWAIPQGDGGRVKGVAFGPGGLCLAEPTIRTDHSPTYRLSSYLLRDGSLRYKAIEHRPPPGPGRGRPAGTTAGPGNRYLSPPDSRAAPPIKISALARRVFGYLPAYAQHLLQEPFLGGQEILRAECHYEGHDNNGWPTELSNYTFVLAGPAQVTVAAGSMIVPAGHTAATAHWSLDCYRGDVARRIGR